MEMNYETHIGDGFLYKETTDNVSENWPPFLQRAWGHKKIAPIYSSLVSPLGDTVAYMTRFPYSCRFGQAVIEVEGIGGFATLPQFRRQGHASRLMAVVLKKAAERVPVIFLHGIDSFYGSFGFTPVAPERTLCFSASAVAEIPLLPNTFLREMDSRDYERVCSLYNEQHSGRPLSAVRFPEAFSGPMPRGDWHPGEEGIILESSDRLRAYAIVQSTTHGRDPFFLVKEAVAANPQAAKELLGVLGQMAQRAGVGKVEMFEPRDSILGRALLNFGGKNEEKYRPDGGWMGKILNRDALVALLTDELNRRSLQPQAEAIQDLASGAFFSNDELLLGLLLGFRSWLDARDIGELSPTSYRDLVKEWFPITGTEALPLPYLHHLDRY